MMPLAFHYLIPTSFVELLVLILIAAPLVGVYSSKKLWRWHKFYESRFLGGLFVASVAATIASTPLALLALRRVVFDNAGPFFGQTEMVAISIIILEGVFFYLVRKWDDLDEDMKRVRIGVEDTSHSTNLPPDEKDN